MLADSRTLETLDFASVRERVVAQTRTERGRAAAADLSPLADFGRVRSELAATGAVRSLVESVDLHVMPAHDTAEWTGRAAVGATLGPTELRAVADAIAAAAAAVNKVRETPVDALAEVIAPYAPLHEVQREVLEAIDEHGAVMDRASPALMRIRKEMLHAQTDARERVQSMLRSSKYANAIQDAVVTIREGRFVVPIKAQFAGEFPGIVHDTSSSGQTLFVEPLASLESNNRVRTLRIEEEREISRILAALSQMVGRHAAQIEANVDALASIDVLVAKAQVARAMNASPPELADTPTIAVHDGRHPLLGARAVPQSVVIDEVSRLIVISGPNMGGKTVALKMVGLFVAMTYAGMHIPAGIGTQIGRFTRIFTDIGDEQSIAENASTFSAHLRRMREIIGDADECALVLVDEIGGGTEPTSGAALAIAMLERLLAVRAAGIVTTHSTELKLFAHATDGVQNASVRFDPRTFAPTYQLDVGAPGQSLAFPLARALGIPPQLIARAESLLSTRERDYERALAELSDVNAQLQSERTALAKERAHLDLLQNSVRSRGEALDRERRAFAARAEQRMQDALREFTAELERRAEGRTRARVTPSTSALLSRTLDTMHHDLGIAPERGDARDAGLFQPGDPVRIRSYDQDGTVIADNGATVLVAIGAMRTVVERGDLLRRESDPSTSGRKRRNRLEGGAAKLEAANQIRSELDVRGKRFVEAEPLLERWIDDAVLAGSTSLRVIHGKGTGMLGRGLQEFLRSHPAVGAVRYGNEDEGGGGVTVFEIR